MFCIFVGPLYFATSFVMICYGFTTIAWKALSTYNPNVYICIYIYIHRCSLLLHNITYVSFTIIIMSSSTVVLLLSLSIGIHNLYGYFQKDRKSVFQDVIEL